MENNNKSNPIFISNSRGTDDLKEQLIKQPSDCILLSKPIFSTQ